MLLKRKRTKQFSVQKIVVVYERTIFPLNGLLCVTIKRSCYGQQDHKNTNKWGPFFRNLMNCLLLVLQSYTLTGLNTYTQYLVSLKAYNPAGDGPETIVVVMTDEGGKICSIVLMSCSLTTGREIYEARLWFLAQ